MAGRGPQSFKKRQKEQQRKEKREEKLAKRHERKAKDGVAEVEIAEKSLAQQLAAEIHEEERL